ncbi:MULTISPECIES: serine hydrolase domain-containing protein [Microbacterium]|jgi:CubicO group peptidase (beta-lactamase class C family)|uniref:serine hydrolase domain-containing protein n=1 Tax=Microbacterium TaxID=33882 RepID=UPI000E72B3DE|nr:MULTISPECIES: serine hydrolase domain-containing protein [Microbacterium]RKE64163.1 CubicO group peptidase (beta-lactamase class C family) [Microbacterium sp. AG238]WJM16220.1 serine hydrolase domain-containing protein [Microbacterium arborescens]
MTSSFTAAFDWARRHVGDGRLPSAVVGIADARGILALDAVAADVDDRYALFSITKPLLGISAARAIERGRLTLQTPLTRALPDFGQDRDDTVRLSHLVSHTSGISEPPLDTRVPLRTELLTRGRDFSAGTASRYSTLAFEGVAALVESVNGHTWHDDIADWASGIGADGLSVDLDGTAPIADAARAGADMAAFAAQRNPGAGLAGRAHDLLALGTELLRIHAGARDGILSPATLAMMLRPLTGDIPRLEPYPAERGQDWGLAWNLRTRAPGLIDRDAYGHGGWAGTEFWVHPGAGIAWVLLTNRAMRPGVDIDELDNAIIGAR